MGKMKEKMNELSFKCKKTFASGKSKLMLTLLTLNCVIAGSFPAYAAGEDGVESWLLTYADKGVNVLFTAVGGIFGLIGIFRGIFAIYKLINAMQDRDGSQVQEASNALALAIFMFLLGILAFVFKAPVLELIHGMGA